MNKIIGRKPRIAVLISGHGSLLMALLNEKIEVSLVVADRLCHGYYETQRQYPKIPTALIQRNFRKDFDRVAFTQNVINVLKSSEIDIVVMAGFMTVFSPEMFEIENFGDWILNIHPSYLPHHKGSHAVKNALASGSGAGTTVHIATAGLDEGPIIQQVRVNIAPDDTEETLHERIKSVERILYPFAVREFAKKFSELEAVG